MLCALTNRRPNPNWYPEILGMSWGAKISDFGPLCLGVHQLLFGVHKPFFGVHFVGVHALFTSQTFLGLQCVWTAFYPVGDDDESAGLSSLGEPLGVYGQSFHSLMAHSLQRRPHAHWGHQKMHRAFAQLRHLMIQNLFLNSYFLVFGCVNSCIGSPQNI